MHSSSPSRTPKLQKPLNDHWQENVGSHQKKILHVQGQKRNHNKMASRAQSCLKSNLIPWRDAWREQTKSWKEHWPPQKTKSDLPLSIWVSPAESWVRSGLPWGQGLWQQQSWEAWHCGTSHPRRGRHLSHYRAAEQTTHRLGNNYSKEVQALL